MPDASPTRIAPAVLWLALVLIGTGWGGTQLLAKIVMSHGNPPLGVALTATTLAALMATALLIVTGRRLPLTRRHIRLYVLCGLTGTALPSMANYTGMRELPVGVMAIVVSVVPITTFLGALLTGLERPRALRLLGLACGTAAVLLLVVPKASLPEPGDAIWVAMPLIAALCYTAENLIVAHFRPPGSDPLQIMCGLVWAAAIMLLPVVALTGTWMHVGGPGTPALVLLTALNLCSYGGYVWLIGSGGPVFAAQVAYVVTLSGVFLGMAVLGEHHSAGVWLSLALMLIGLALVRPR